MTKAEARRLARYGRTTYGSYRISAKEQAYPCPLAEKLRQPGHRITVWHQPWEKVTAPMVDAAIVEHLTTDDDDERCPYINDQEK